MYVGSDTLKKASGGTMRVSMGTTTKGKEKNQP